MRLNTRLIVTAAICWITVCLMVSGATAATYHVPVPFPTIQAGIDAAALGDTVLVAPGTYMDFETRVQVGGGLWTACVFLKDGVHVRSESGPEVTTIDQSNLIGPSIHGVIARYLASASTSIEGFSLVAPHVGNGVYMWLNENVTVKNCKFRDFDAVLGSGGGMIAVGNATVIDCEFTNCHAAVGGAIWASSGQIELIRCTFRQCSTGAVAIDQPGSLVVTALVEDCRFLDNTAPSGTASLGISRAGGGATVRGCYFENNVNLGTGGGALGIGSGPKTVENCVFVNNGTPSSYGGAIFSFAEPATVRNCTFVGNYKGVAPSVGGSAIVSSRQLVCENNIFLGSLGGGDIGHVGSSLTTSCNVTWDNPQGLGVPLSATDRIIDPQFCNPDAGDFTLRVGSPCLPDDPLGCGLTGAFEQGCGTVSVESKSWGTIKGLYR